MGDLTKQAEDAIGADDAASDWNASHDVGPLIDAIWHLDKAADVAKLTVLAVPRA